MNKNEFEKYFKALQESYQQMKNEEQPGIGSITGSALGGDISDIIRFHENTQPGLKAAIGAYAGNQASQEEQWRPTIKVPANLKAFSELIEKDKEISLDPKNRPFLGSLIPGAYTSKVPQPTNDEQGIMEARKRALEQMGRKSSIK